MYPVVVLTLISVRLPLFYRTILSPLAENSIHRDPHGVSASSKAFGEPLSTTALGFWTPRTSTIVRPPTESTAEH